MSTESRKAAKEAIEESPDQNDPELQQKLDEAKDFQLNLEKEKNKHEQAMLAKNLGFLGRFFGDGRNTPTFVAMVALAASIILFFVCLILAYQSPDSSEFWSEQAGKAMALGTAALAYIFGAANKN